MDYPVPQFKLMLSKIITYTQYASIALSLFGDKIFGYFGMAYPWWYLKMKENKWTTFIAIFLGGNFINGQLTQTGAFEIFINDRLVFSKIQTNRLPSLEEIVRIVERNM